MLGHCQFINGPEVTELEAELAAIQRRQARGELRQRHRCAADGADGQGIGRGDAVFCPSFTFCATGEVVALTGATPVFVDVDEATFNIDPASLKRGIATAKRLGLKPVGGDPGRPVRAERRP